MTTEPRAPFAPVPGYATAADAALTFIEGFNLVPKPVGWSEAVATISAMQSPCDNLRHTCAVVLAAEVRRQRDYICALELACDSFALRSARGKSHNRGFTATNE